MIPIKDIDPRYNEPEEWRPLIGWDGYYEISSYGRCRSIARRVSIGSGWRIIPQKVLFPIYREQDGRPVYNLTKTGKRQQIHAYLAVLEAFIGPRPAGMEGCHNNGDSKDCRLRNLRWDTRSANHIDALRHGTYGKLNEQIVRALRSGAISTKFAVAATGATIKAVRAARRGETWRHVK